MNIMAKSKPPIVYYAMIKDFQKLNKRQKKLVNPNGTMNRFSNTVIKVTRQQDGFVCSEYRTSYYPFRVKFHRNLIEWFIVEKEYTKKKLEML